MHALRSIVYEVFLDKASNVLRPISTGMGNSENTQVPYCYRHGSAVNIVALPQYVSEIENITAHDSPITVAISATKVDYLQVFSHDICRTFGCEDSLSTRGEALIQYASIINS